MTVVERSTLGILVTIIGLAIVWGASTLIDLRGQVAVLEVQVESLKADTASLPDRMTKLESKVDALPAVLRSVLEEHEANKARRRP